VVDSDTGGFLKIDFASVAAPDVIPAAAVIVPIVFIEDHGLFTEESNGLCGKT
jgi:hypothetical protein